MMQAYLGFQSLLFSVTILSFLWVSFATAIVTRGTNISNDKDIKNVYRASKREGIVQESSLGSRAKHITLDVGEAIVIRGISARSSPGFRSKFGPTEADIPDLKRRSVLDEKRSFLQARTNEKTNPRLQIKPQIDQNSPQRRKRRVRGPPYLQQHDFIPQTPVKRPRLDRSGAGDWKRKSDQETELASGTKASPKSILKQDNRVVKPFNDVKAKPEPEPKTSQDEQATRSAKGVKTNPEPDPKKDDRPRSPFDLAKQIRGHTQAAGTSTIGSHLLPGAQVHSQALPKLRLASMPRADVAGQRHTDAHVTVSTRPRSGILDPKANPQSISLIEAAIPTGPRTGNQDVSRPDPASLNRRIESVGHRLAALSPNQRKSSGSQGTIINDEGTRSAVSQEAASARRDIQHVARFPSFIPQAEQLNRLVDSTELQAQRPQFAVPLARFPNSIPQSDKLNQMLDAARAHRSQLSRHSSS